MPERNITFEIKEHLGTIASYDKGWNKELNLISWNGATAKFDIRDWDDHHERMGKGITLSQRDMRRMVDLYISRNNDLAVARGKAIEEERNARRYGARKENAYPTPPFMEVETEAGNRNDEKNGEVEKENQEELKLNANLDLDSEAVPSLTAEDCNLVSVEPEEQKPTEENF